MTIAATTCVLERDRLMMGLSARCLHCGHRFTVGAVAWVMRAGHERIGFICPDCLTGFSREVFAVLSRGEDRTSDDFDDDAPEEGAGLRRQPQRPRV